MIDDQTDSDLRQAVDGRLAARIENARRRRAAREQARAYKQARRAAGLRKRHVAKLARLDEQTEDTTS